MKNSILKVIFLIFVLFLPFHATYAETKLLDTKVRHDRKFDFNSLNKSYQWVIKKDSTTEPILAERPELDGWIRSAVENVLNGKGYQQDNDSDSSFGVAYQLILEEEGTDPTHVRRGGGRMNRYTYANIEGMPGFKDWVNGTLILNIVNPKTGFVVWVGYAEALVVDKKGREELINQAASKMLEKFPP
jgi:hypothetical protein